MRFICNTLLLASLLSNSTNFAAGTKPVKHSQNQDDEHNHPVHHRRSLLRGRRTIRGTINRELEDVTTEINSLELRKKTKETKPSVDNMGMTDDGPQLISGNEYDGFDENCRRLLRERNLSRWRTSKSSRDGIFGALTITSLSSYSLFSKSRSKSGDSNFPFLGTDEFDGELINCISEASSPVAGNDVFNTHINTPVSIETSVLLVNDHDPQGNDLAIQQCSDPDFGEISQPKDDAILYSPPEDWLGLVTFECVVTNNVGQTDTSTVTVNVLPQPPVVLANDDSFTTPEDTPVVIDILENDSDAITIATYSTPQFGTIHTNTNDDNTTSYIYVPAPDWHGVDVFEYTVTGDDGNTDTASVSITVESQLDAPIASDDSYVVEVDTELMIDVLLNDVDPENGELSLVSYTNPVYGSLSSSGEILTYMPGDGFVGIDTFVYTVVNEQGLEDTGTVTIEVIPPGVMAGDDAYTTVENTPVVLDVMENDTGNSELSVLSYSNPENGSLDPVGETLTYTPFDGFVGLDTFVYTVVNDDGAESTATVIIEITPSEITTLDLIPSDVMFPTLSAEDDSYCTDKDTPIVLDILENDVDPEGGTLSIVTHTDPIYGVLIFSGEFCTYYPADGFVGIDTFVYTVINEQGEQSTATVTIEVTPADVATQDDEYTTPSNTPLTLDVLENDSDDVSDLTLVSYTDPENGSLDMSGDTLTYTPSDGFVGEDTFMYTVVNEDGGQGTATVTINIVAADVDTQDDTFSTTQDVPVVLDILENDSDDASDLTLVSYTDPENGSLDMSGDSLTYTPSDGFVGEDTFVYTVVNEDGGQGTATVTINIVAADVVTQDDEYTTPSNTPLTLDIFPEDETLNIVSHTDPTYGVLIFSGEFCTYYPAEGFVGEDTFMYTVVNEQGEQSTSTVTIIVTPADDFVDDEYTTPLNTPLTLDIIPEDGTLSIVSHTDPIYGVVIFTDFLCTYYPADGFVGIDTFVYTVMNEQGEQSTATVTIEVKPADVATQDDTFSTTQGIPVVLDILENDSDDVSDLTLVSYTDPENGSLDMSGDTLTYTPSDGFVGEDTFVYTVVNDEGGQGTATVTIKVTPSEFLLLSESIFVLDVESDTFSTPESTSLILDVLENDVDPDGNNLSLVSYTDPDNGSLVLSGDTLLYTPLDGYVGLDTFTYTVTNILGVEGSATVGIEVTPAEVEAKDDVYSTLVDTSITLDVLKNDVNPLNDNLSIVSHTDPDNGSLVFSENLLIYTPSDGFMGVDTFVYTVTNEKGGQGTATVTIEIIPPDLQARDDFFSTLEDTEIVLDVSENDSPDKDSFYIVSHTNPVFGTVVKNVDETLTYIPNENFNGVDTFEYIIQDTKTGKTDNASVFITVKGVNDQPTAVGDFYVTYVNVPLVLDAPGILANDIEVDPTDELYITDFATPEKGTLTLNADGSMVYLPDMWFMGTVAFDYVISDGHGGQSIAKVTIEVVQKDSPTIAIVPGVVGGGGRNGTSSDCTMMFTNCTHVTTVSDTLSIHSGDF